MSSRLRALWVVLVAVCMIVVLSNSPTIRCARLAPGVCQKLRDAYPRIRDEYSALHHDLITQRHRSPNEWGSGDNIRDLVELHRRSTGWMYAWKNSTEANQGWLNFGLVLDGRPMGRNCELCPFTMRVLKDIPGVRIAGFSLLKPKASIEPHTDKLHHRNRTFHLGISMSDDCYLFVKHRRKIRRLRQTEGEAIWFDSRQVHWVDNPHQQCRTVLYLDVYM